MRGIFRDFKMIKIPRKRTNFVADHGEPFGHSIPHSVRGPNVHYRVEEGPLALRERGLFSQHILVALIH